MDAWLGAVIETHDGRAITFGPEEDTERLPTALSFSTQIPGGFGKGSLVVPRPDGFDPLDTPLLAGARFYGPGNRTAYEGRLAAKPRLGVNDITLELEGWSAHLDDDIFRALYVTRDLNRWGPPGLQRQINLAEVDNAPHQADASALTDANGNGLRLAVTGVWTTPIPRCEAWFDASSGLAVGMVAGDFVGWPDTAFVLTLNGGNDEVGGAPTETGSDLFTAASGSFAHTFSQAFRRAWFEWHYNGAGGVDANTEYGLNLYNLAAYGDHGLTLYVAADGGAKGVRGDDALRDAISRAAPLLNTDDIEQAQFVITDLVFDGWDSRVRNVVEQVTAKGGASDVPNDWGVYEDKRFFWRTPGSYGRTHRLRLDEGVEIVDEGEDAAEIATAIIATYTDSAGNQKAVGYPGSGADVESALLVVTDPKNPIALSDVDRKVITKDVGKQTPEGAVLFAQLALKEALRADRTGTYRVPSLPNDEPPYYLRAGDKVLIEDDAAVEQSTVSTDYDHSDGEVEVHIGTAPNRLDVFLAQAAA